MGLVKTERSLPGGGRSTDAEGGDGAEAGYYDSAGHLVVDEDEMGERESGSPDGMKWGGGHVICGMEFGVYLYSYRGAKYILSTYHWMHGIVVSKYIIRRSVYCKYMMLHLLRVRQVLFLLHDV